MRLKGKVAIVTGGGRGIGRAIAHALAEEGVIVVIAARTQEELDTVAEEVRALDGKALEVRVDVRVKKDVERLIETTLTEHSKIDILVNNAGIGVRKTLLETLEDEWDEIMDTNLKGVFLCSKAVLPVMLERGDGVIVNIASGAGKYGFPELAAYCASKFGVVGLTQSLAREVADKGVRVYSLCPGGVDTDMYRRFFPGEDYSLLLRPEEVAAEVVKLCLPGNDTPQGSCLDIF